MSAFADELASLVAKETAACRRDPERLAAMIERLAGCTGMVVAVAAKGDPAQVDRLIIGVESYAHEEAVNKSRVIRIMNGGNA